MSTSGGAIAAPVVVNAAGPAAARVGRLGRPRAARAIRGAATSSTRSRSRASPAPCRITTDTGSGFYFRKEMEQLLLSPGDVKDIGDDLAAPVDWAMMEEAVAKAVHRVPVIERARIAGGWAGLRPLTPDDHAIIGWAPGVEGFFLAVGWGGHGFQHSPATGRLVAEWIARRHGRPWTSRSSTPRRFAGRTPPLPGEGRGRGPAGAE